MKTKISLQELKKAYFPDANDIEDVFNNANINRYSIWKPTSCYTNIKSLDLDSIKKSNCSLRPKAITQWGDPSIFETLDTDWEYVRPTGGEIDPFRIGDFKNYNPDALPPFESAGNLTVSRKVLEGVTSNSKVNFKIYSRYTEMTWGLKGNENENMTPLDFIVSDLTEYRLCIAVYIPETSKWEFFESDSLSKYPEDDILYNPDGTLQGRQYLNRLPRFSSNIPGVKAILNSTSKEFYYLPCLIKNDTTIALPGIKPSKLKIEDYEFDPGLANDCPDLYIDQMPDKWVVALVYERDANGLVYVEKDGSRYYKSTCYLLNKTHPQYLTNYEVSWSASYMHATVLQGNPTITVFQRTPSGLADLSYASEIVLNNKSYFAKQLFTGYVDTTTITFSYGIDIDYFNN